MIFLNIILSFVVTFAGAQTETDSTSEKNTLSRSGPQYKDTWVEGLHWLYPESMKSEKKRIETAYKKERKSPLEQAGEKAIGRELRTIREKFLSTDTGEGLDQLLAKLEDGYEKLKDDDTRLFVAVIMPMKSLRGLIWRANDIILENKKLYIRYTDLFNSYMDYARQFMPLEDWDAGREFFLRPFVEGESFVSMFKNERDVQNYFAFEVYPALAKAAKRLQQLNFQNDRALIWDNRLVHGIKGFQNVKERYRWLEEADVLQIRAMLHGSMAEIAKQSAFSPIGFTGIAYESPLESLGLGFFGMVNSQTPSQTSALLRRYADYGHFQENGSAWMKAAFENIKQAVQLNRLAIDIRRMRPTAARNFLSSPWIYDVEHTGEVLFEKTEKILQGSFEYESEVTADSAVLNLPEFYQTPPEDLKKFLPIDFVQGMDKTDVKLQAGGRSRWTYFPNYKKGQAAKWDLPTYKKLFPEEKNARGIADSLRLVRQGLGGWALILPF